MAVAVNVALSDGDDVTAVAVHRGGLPSGFSDPRFQERFRPRVLSTTLALTWVAAGRRAAYVTEGQRPARGVRRATPPDVDYGLRAYFCRY
jgi:hypothetical protein